MKMRQRFILAGILIALTAGFYHYGRGLWYPYYAKIVGRKTVASVISDIGAGNRQRWQADFAVANVVYPPQQVTLLAIKSDDILEVWTKDANDHPQRIKTFPILAASGQLGPKLREGDRQVPEGIYRITGLNPNSSYHLSMKLNYPNAFDLQHANAEGRTEPGSNIFIHGKAASIGCLAMGDSGIEQLFTLVNDVGVDNVVVIIAPTDPRTGSLIAASDTPHWTSELYRDIEQAVNTLRPLQ